MLISAFFPKVDGKIKAWVDASENRGVSKIPSLGERTKGWRNSYLESQLPSQIAEMREQRRPWSQALSTFPSLQQGSPSSHRGQQRGLEARLVEWCQPDMGTPSLHRIHPPHSPHHRCIHCSIEFTRTGEEERKEMALFATEGSPHALWFLYIYNFSMYIYSSAEEWWRPSVQPSPDIIRMLKSLKNFLTFSIILEKTSPGQKLSWSLSKKSYTCKKSGLMGH